MLLDPWGVLEQWGCLSWKPQVKEKMVGVTDDKVLTSVKINECACVERDNPGA